jgi:hypothetical protein
LQQDPHCAISESRQDFQSTDSLQLFVTALVESCKCSILSWGRYYVCLASRKKRWSVKRQSFLFQGELYFLEQLNAFLEQLISE